MEVMKLSKTIKVNRVNMRDRKDRKDRKDRRDSKFYRVKLSISSFQMGRKRKTTMNGMEKK